MITPERRIVVTGAAGGIGRVVALQLAAQGVRLSLLDRDAGALAAVGADVAASGAPVPLALPADVADRAELADALRRAAADGPLDGLVSAAGILEPAGLAEVTEESWHRHFAVNTTGVFHLLQEGAPRLRDGAAIVVISSNAARVPRLGMLAYAASKAATSALTRCAGLELAARGVRCNVVEPGSTDTAMQRALWPDPDAGAARAVDGDPGAFRVGIPLGRIGDPADVAAVVCFLLSDASRHVTLQQVFVDGGRVAVTELVECGRSPAVHAPTPLFAGDAIISGAALETIEGRGAKWADRVLASLRPGQRALVVLPFAPDAAGVAHRVAAGAAPASVLSSPGLGAARHTVTERPSRERYADRVRTALDWIAAGRLQKVVLGRSLEVRSDPPLDGDAVIARLLADRPGRYVFRVPLSADPAGPVLLGASPELLVSRRWRVVRSLPLAGSAPRSSDAGEDGHRLRALLNSAKDRREHAFVVEAVVAALGTVCDGVVADELRIVSTDTLHHLGTRLGGTLAPDVAPPSALHLAHLLHPTPAIGGAPTASALRVIGELEEDRGPLTGVVGWVDGTGDGEFAIAIRAGVLDGELLRLYAGAGIVAGSDPDAEVRETGAKLTTMLKAVGL